MKKVIEEKTQITQHFKSLLKEIDFSDTFSTTNQSNNIEDITSLIFNTTPKWIDVLFNIRNKIVSILGLKTTKPADYNEDFKVGGYIAFFKIYSIEDDEIVLGADDSHLNFKAIIQNTKSPNYNIKVTTLVEYNNRMGKIYMGIVKPFHKIVLMRMVRNAFKTST